MAVRILFFGRLRDAAGESERLADIPDAISNVPQLIEWLSESDQTLREALSAPAIRVAIDQTVVDAGAALPSTPKEIAFMAPFSGG